MTRTPSPQNFSDASLSFSAPPIAGRDIDLLSDASGAVSQQFDCELSLVVVKFSARKTFLLSPKGEILAKWSEGNGTMADIKDGSHAAEVLAAIDAVV